MEVSSGGWSRTLDGRRTSLRSASRGDEDLEDVGWYNNGEYHDSGEVGEVGELALQKNVATWGCLW